jgi:hypothetical protein
MMVEEDGDDSFVNTETCTKFSCNNAKLINVNGWILCPVCECSYGKENNNV